MFALTFALAGNLGCAEEPRTVAAKDYSNALALGYCKAVYSCPCPTYPYENANACFSSLANAYNKVVNEAAFAGLSYDGTCPGQELDFIESLGCSSTTTELPAGICLPPCHAWHGNTQAGGPCQVFATSAERGLAFSNCGQGLNCVAQVCVNPCQSAQALPQLGQPCPNGFCTVGAMCDATMTCVAQASLPGVGAVCLDGQCDPKRAVCVDGANVCAALPNVGEACVAGQCVATAYCGPNNICLARPAIACSLLGGGSFPGDGDGDGDPTTGDGDGDPGFDNQAACESFFTSYNNLDCVDPASRIDPVQFCSGYTDSTVNCSNIFNCWTNNLECVDYGGGVFAPSNYSEGCPQECL